MTVVQLHQRAGWTGTGKGKMTETATATGIGGRVAAYIDALNASSSEHHHFTTQTGRKYIKVIDSRPGGHGGSVHAFIDASTGDVYKPAGWSQPAKHVRFHLMDDTSYAELIGHASSSEAYSGGYLYL